MKDAFTFRTRLSLLRLQMHYEKKSTAEHLFWCFTLSQIEESIQYLEGPNSTWMDHDKNLGVYLWQPEAPEKVLWSTFCSQSVLYTGYML